MLHLFYSATLKDVQEVWHTFAFHFIFPSCIILQGWQEFGLIGVKGSGSEDVRC